MIKVNWIDVYNFDSAVRGMRNPYNSWEKSDSGWVEDVPGRVHYLVGENDLKLMKKLFKAGSEHRKFLRQIFVSMDVVAPLYWWKQFDKYQVGVTTNSCSTMHTLTKREFELEDFSIDCVDEAQKQIAKHTIQFLNSLRNIYIERNNDPDYWRFLVQMLPESYNQKRTVTLNYEVICTMIKQRKGHKLAEWEHFSKIMLDELPYLKEIVGD